MVVFKCHRSEEAVGLANFKKKSMGKVGPVPMGQRFQTKFLIKWLRISLKYSSGTQGVMVFDSTEGEKAVELSILEGDPVPMGLDLVIF